MGCVHSMPLTSRQVNKARLEACKALFRDFIQNKRPTVGQYMLILDPDTRGVWLFDTLDEAMTFGAQYACNRHFYWTLVTDI